jgi:hypothetical protein
MRESENHSISPLFFQQGLQNLIRILRTIQYFFHPQTLPPVVRGKFLTSYIFTLQSKKFLSIIRIARRACVDVLNLPGK